MRYVLLATDATLPKDRSTRYYEGRGLWSHSKQYAKRYSASDAAMMKVGMADNPQRFEAEHLTDIEAVPA